MKALSLTQPWATLVATGAKQYETRSWPTYYRGPLVIHAAKGFPAWARDTCFHMPFNGALNDAGYLRSKDLPFGAIIGIVTLVDCLGTTDPSLRLLRPEERHFGDYAPGRFAWQFTEPLRFDAPIPCKGALGLWTVPDEIARALEMTLGERVA